jgi:ATP-dependent RNA helicase MSS116
MTKVQEVSLPIIQKGIDVCAKAKTGTGKTLGFLIPTIDVIANDKNRLDGRKDISALILSPTRELASQIKVRGATPCD